jgi:transcriptional regulator with XRE-family HTH domain
MTVNLGTTDELWDLEPPKFLPRSRLFHQLPIGVGTPHVESLTSYVSRLAVAHSVSTGTLLAIEVGPLIKTNYPPSRKSIVAIYGQESVRALNGIRLGALQLVQALEKLTLRTDLRFLTMLPWAEVFPVLGLLKHKQAWCPLCLQELLENRKEIYLPLLWALNVIKVCPYHYQPLQLQCPHCHAQFLPLWRSSRPGYCLKCSGWLGSSKDARDVEPNFVKAADEFQWDIWAANTVGDLIAKAPYQPSPLPRETIKKSLVFFVNKFSNGNVLAFEQLIKLSQSEITQWYSGTTIPTLDKLLRICYQLKISLSEFLQPEILPQPSINQVALCLSSRQRQSTATSQRNKERIRSLLKSVLSQNEYPSPSVREVARRYHVSCTTFYYYAPDLCQAISARYWDYKKLVQQQTIQRGISEVKRLAPELVAQGITPSVKNLKSVMTNPEALWHEEVLETLSEVRRSLGELPSR